MGFTIEDYSEIVDDYQCFEAVNIPWKHHPCLGYAGHLLPLETASC